MIANNIEGTLTLLISTSYRKKNCPIHRAQGRYWMGWWMTSQARRRLWNSVFDSTLHYHHENMGIEQNKSDSMMTGRSCWAPVKRDSSRDLKNQYRDIYLLVVARHLTKTHQHWWFQNQVKTDSRSKPLRKSLIMLYKQPGCLTTPTVFYDSVIGTFIIFQLLQR